MAFYLRPGLLGGGDLPPGVGGGGGFGLLESPLLCTVLYIHCLISR